MILSPPDRPKRSFVKKLRPSENSGTDLENYSGLKVNAINLPALATEIFLLLKEDMRLESERGIFDIDHR
ncbi:MAG: hypothetical protein D6768_03025 [Chloroflexi bacterium]|nr:MAG: hypothetical protein D6768_03025 [Chloroflexota bacterium]